MVKKEKVIKRIVALSALVLLVGALGFYIFYYKENNSVPNGYVKANGRIEAIEVDIATKLPGRLVEVLAKEGDSVEANQIVARMDTNTLEAQLRQAEAEVRRAREARQSALSKVEESHGRVVLAGKELERSKSLLAKHIVTQQQYERDETTKQSIDAVYSASKSMVAEADAAIESAIALTERLKVEIEDGVLKSPRKGRVMTRLAEPGEVLPAGGKILSIIDLDDMYMNVYLPEQAAGKISIGADAMVVTDAFPEKPIPAKVTFVSEKAQFTPKEVEAFEERQKLVFRVKVCLTEKGDSRLKPGIPGVAYVCIDPLAKWSDLPK